MFQRFQHHPATVAGMRFRLILAFIIGVGFIGCSDDDERSIQVCNGDNREYSIKLHRYSDGKVMMDFYLKEFYHSDSCDRFEDPPEGRYYIAIYEDGGQQATSRSRDFYLDDDDYLYFRIDSTGTIKD